MKTRILLLGILVFTCSTLRAQWQTNGNNINNTNAGNVGIGIVNPDMKLDVRTNSGSITRFHSYGGQLISGIRIGRDGAFGDIVNLSEGFGIGSGTSSGDLPISSQLTDNVDFFISNTTGNVGIGTTNPDMRLHIRTDSEYITRFHSSGTQLINGIRIGRNGAYGDIVNLSGGFGIGSGTSSGNLPLSSQFTNYIDFFISNTTGNVGIFSTSPSYKLHVNGTAGKPGGGSWTNASDLRLKQDVEAFTDGLEVLQKINPVWYRYNGKAGMPTDEKYVGIIAQDMQKAAPYTIGTFTHEDENGNTATYLDYDSSAVTYITINAIKEQQQLIATQQQHIETLQEELETLKNIVYGSDTKAQDNLAKTTDPAASQNHLVLYQNVPNPFNQRTTINAVVPENVQQAKIMVYNLNGLELERYDVNQRGKVTVEISAGRFPSGIYIYTLVADNKVIATKKMILTK